MWNEWTYKNEEVMLHHKKKRQSETSSIYVCKYHKHIFGLLHKFLVCANKEADAKVNKNWYIKLCWQNELSPHKALSGKIAIYL